MTTTKYRRAEDYVKPGMKARLRRDLKDMTDYGLGCYVRSMAKPGSTIVVSKVHPYGAKFYAEGSGDYLYSVDMLENPEKLDPSEKITYSIRYKKGDKVQIREDLVEGRNYGGMSWHRCCFIKAGSTSTVANVKVSKTDFGQIFYGLVDDPNGFYPADFFVEKFIELK